MSFSLQGQSAWEIIENEQVATAEYGDPQVEVSSYVVAKLNTEIADNILINATPDNRSNSIEGSQKIGLPMPNGEMHKFYLYDSPVMHPELGAKYPELKTYRLVSSIDKKITGRFARTPSGLHATIRTTRGEIYIDPYSSETSELHISYYTTDQLYPENLPKPACGLDFDPADLREHFGTEHPMKVGEESLLKKYRFALACTGEWGSNFGSKAQVLEQMVIATNRVNESLENEASIFFELIPNNEDIIFLDPISDPYIITPNPEDGQHPGRQVLGQNTGVINSNVGANNYDVGHVFTRSCTDGIAGVASLASVCTDNKGAGISCVGGANLISFMVQTTLHEIGHQFGASHTWSNCGGNAEDQLAPSTAAEPGSGTTFMSYAGVCGGNTNVSGNNDAYFHVASLQQMYNLLKNGNGSLCGEDEDVGNTAPTASHDYEDDFVIPVFTPFELTGSGSDMEDDPLTYCWEQMNFGPISPYGQPIGDAPSFRSFAPSESPTRVFPRIDKLLANSFDLSEVLQSNGRNYTFFLTVRDNHPGGGTAHWTSVDFSSNSAAGPFFVVAPNNNEQLEVGKPYSITWEVANTDQAPVNCENVNIFLSADGGQNFDILLAYQTPNDGEETVIVPNYVTQQARVKIKASNNIFFDISNFNFDINEATVPSFYMGLSEFEAEVCTPDVIEVDVTSESLAGFAGDVALSVETDLPAETIITLSEESISGAEGTALLTLDFANVNATGTYEVNVRASSDGLEDIVQTLLVTITSSNFDDFALTFPELNSSGVSQLPTFEWANTLNGTSYTLEYGTNPALGSTATVISGLNGNTYTPTTGLEKNSVYYWKVYVGNKCADAESELFMFATEALSCSALLADDVPISISQSGQPTITSSIFLAGAGQVTDVNISNVRGTHENVGNLTMTLISPSLTEVVLVEERCNFQADFNCGFDDDAASEVSCPLSTGSTYIPKESLSIFNGEDIAGDWVLRIEDGQSGEGGQLNGFELEICSNATLEGPSLVTNEALGVPTDGANRIGQDLLLTEDSNNGASELIYTIVTTPLYGTMTVSGTEVTVGSTFTQQDINDKNVRYQHDVTEETADNFTFTVVDGEGGWIPLTTYTITIADGLTSGIEDEMLNLFSLDVYPNPANTQLNIEVNSEQFGDYALQLLSVTGNVILTENLNVKDRLVRTLDISTLPEGMYMVKLTNGSQQQVNLTTIQR